MLPPRRCDPIAEQPLDRHWPDSRFSRDRRAGSFGILVGVTDQVESPIEYVSADELQARFADRPSSTPDDVGIRLSNGEHLRTRREVLAFIKTLDGS